MCFDGVAVPEDTVCVIRIHHGDGQPGAICWWVLQGCLQCGVVCSNGQGFDPGVEAAGERAGLMVGLKPGQHRGGKSAKVMPSGATPGSDDEVLEAEVALFHLVFPQFQCGVRDAKSQVCMVQVEQGFPQEPLIREPDGPVPVAIRFVIRRALIDRHQTDRAPHLLWGEHALQDALLLLRSADASEQRADAVQTQVEVFPAGMPQDLTGLSVLIMEDITEDLGGWVPGVLLQRLREGIDIRLIIADILRQLQDMSDICCKILAVRMACALVTTGVARLSSCCWWTCTCGG